MKKFLILIMVSVMLNGCYSTRITNPGVKAGVEIERWRSHALFGLVQYQDELYTTSCAGKPIAYVETYFSFPNILINGLLALVSSGLSPFLYMTNTVRVGCAV